MPTGQTCMFPRCPYPVDESDGHMCSTHYAMWEADAYHCDAAAAAEELLPPMIQIARQLGTDYFEELLLEAQERARRDAYRFQEGYNALYDQAQDDQARGNTD